MVYIRLEFEYIHRRNKKNNENCNTKKESELNRKRILRAY